jgi:hypothetical protein
MLARRASIAIAFICCVSAANAGVSQTPKRYLHGTIVDPLGNSIAYATVQVNADARGITDQSGVFRLEAPKQGKFLLTVRRIGYKAFAGEFNAPADSTLRIVMDWVVKTLEPVQVAAHSINSLETHGFYARMAEQRQGRNSGYFITPEEVDLRQPTLASQMLNGMPGIRVAMIPGIRPPKWMVYGQNGCIGNIYVNGTRLNMLNLPKSSEAESAAFDEIVPTADLAGIELYTRGTHAPTNYQSLNGSCAVVLIWTK